MSRFYFLVAVALLFGVTAETQAQSFGPVQTFAVDPVRVAPAYASPVYAAPVAVAPRIGSALAPSPVDDCHTHYAARPVFAAPQIVQPFRRVMRPIVTYSPFTSPVVAQTTYRPVAPAAAYLPIIPRPVVAYSPVAAQPVLVARPPVFGYSIYGQPTAYVVGQPVRNVVRYVTP